MPCYFLAGTEELQSTPIRLDAGRNYPCRRQLLFARVELEVPPPVASPVVACRKSGAYAPRLPQLELLLERDEAARIFAMQVLQQPLAIADHLDKTTAGAVILGVCGQVFFQMLDARGK